MSPGGRQVVGVVFGFAAAAGVVYLTEVIARNSVPIAGGGHISSGAQLKSAMEAGRIPFNALLLVLGGWLVAACLGSIVARRLSRGRQASILVAALLTAFVFFKLAAAPHPAWMWLGGLVGVPLFALGALGERLTLRAP
jgi:hypothetical protein